MCADEAGPENFDELLRSIAEEVGRSIERLVNRADVEEFADAVGVDPDRAREWTETAGSWLRQQAESFGGDVGGRRAPAESEDPLRHAEPSALDLPTDEQGLALAALESGRWVVEPGSRTLAVKGEGPGPSDALGLFRELLVRDWISVEGEVTLVGHRALGRWLDAAER